MIDSNRVGLGRAGTFFREHPRTRRSAIALAVVALLLVVLLIVTPMAAAWYAEGWLRDNGAGDARIGNIDFNPFTATLRVEDLHAGGGEGARLQVELAEVDLYWWPLFSQRAHVETLRLVGVRADVVGGDAGSLKVGAVSIPAAAPAAEPEPAPMEEAVAWGIGSELVDLRDVVVTYRHDIYDTEVHIRTVRLGSHFSWLGEESAELVLDMTVDGSPLTLRSDVAPWSDEPSLSGNLTLAGVALADYASEVETLAGVQGLRGQLAMDLALAGNLGSDGVLRLDISGPLNLDDGGFALPGLVAASHTSLRWAGTLSLALPAPAGEPLMRLDGAVQLTGAGASVALAGSSDGGDQDAPLDVRLGDLRWQGQAAFAPAEDDGPPMLTASGGVALRDLAVDRADLPMQLLRLGGLRVRDLAVGGIADVTVDSVGLDGVRLLGAKGDDAAAPVLTFAGLSAAGLSYSGAAVTLESLTLTDPALAVVREANGDIARVTPLLAALQTEAGDTAAPAAEEPAEAVAPAADWAGDAAPLAIRVDRLRITASDWLSFGDRSVSPPADFALTELDVTVENIDTAAADPMSVTLATGDGRQTRLAVAGTVAAFAEQMRADLEVDLDNLELPPLSPYVPTYNIFRGRLSAESAVALAGEQLDVQNALTIERLQLAGKAGDQDDGVLAQGMAMPVDVALDLLRDREDRIRLDLPVTGSLDNPNFGTGDIIRQATQRALQNAAMSYVKNALQPLGTLMLVGNLAAKAARPRFEPIEMAPGETELPDSGKAYLDKLGGMLAERPGLRLTICGVATAADREVLAAAAAARLDSAQDAAADAAEPGAVPAGDTPAGDADAAPPDEGGGEVQPPAVSPAELLELAQLRTTRVISYLSSREGVDRERLFLCRETIEDDADATPRVEITL